MKQNITELIERSGKNSLFIGKADDKRIEQIEEMLNLTLPDSFRWFLSEFGHGGIFGVEILGSGLAEIPSCVSATYDWRGFGLPSNLIVVEDSGSDWLYCLDTSRMIGNECPVVDWEQDVGIGNIDYKDFYAFLEDRFSR